jgi:hypothetical protein
VRTFILQIIVLLISSVAYAQNHDPATSIKSRFFDFICMVQSVFSGTAPMVIYICFFLIIFFGFVFDKLSFPMAFANIFAASMIFFAPEVGQLFASILGVEGVRCEK